MASSSIALRFRDSTPGVDTINAHLNIIFKRGSAWWGWWKKETEDYGEDVLIRAVPASGRTTILLVDRSRERMWVAACTGWTRRLPDNEVSLVPDYYREHIGQIFAFLRFEAIRETEFDASVAEAIGDRTIIDLSDSARKPVDYIAVPARSIDRSSILHLSDLHFGADYGFRLQRDAASIGDSRTTLTDALTLDLDRIGLRTDVGSILVTGDFVTQGKWTDNVRKAALQEFETLREKLRLTPNQIIAVPGNHDIVRYPEGQTLDVAEQSVGHQTNLQHEREFRTFVDELVGRNWKESLSYVRRVSLKNVDLLVCVLNSCCITATEWTEYGYVGRNGFDVIQSLGNQVIDRPTYKFLALHHHLLPVADVEAPNSKGVSLTLDASRLLDAAQQAGVHIALHGHQHMPKLTRYQNIPFMGGQASEPVYILAGGSSGARGSRLPGNERNTYCVFQTFSDGIELYVRELRTDAREGATLFRGKLEVAPFVA